MKMIKVRVHAQETVYYNQVIEIDEKEFKRLSKLLDDDELEATDLIFDQLDLDDIIEVSDMEISEFKKVGD